MIRGIAADASWRGRHATTIGIVRTVAFILLLPLLAMQITDEVVWGPFDFAVAGALLIGTGLAYRAATRSAGVTAYKVAVGAALGAALLLVWSVLAVGVIGTEGDPADLMYGAVLAVGIIGAAIARFQPQGMARALLAMALAQALVAVVALIAGKHQAPISSVSEIVGVNALFVALFAGSAWLFRRAAGASSR
jgi:hypothetical protein